MKQEEYLAAIKKQQSLIRKLFASRKRRSECIDEITNDRYGHLVGKFFKADGEYFKQYKGVTFYIAKVHGNIKDAATDEVVVCLECRFIMQSAVLPGLHIECDSTNDNIGFYTEMFRFGMADNLDEILAPLYIPEEKAAKEVSEIYNAFIDKFLKKGQ
jgi:hypothetical protein